MNFISHNKILGLNINVLGTLNSFFLWRKITNFSNDFSYNINKQYFKFCILNFFMLI